MARPLCPAVPRVCPASTASPDGHRYTADEHTPPLFHPQAEAPCSCHSCHFVLCGARCRPAPQGCRCPRRRARSMPLWNARLPVKGSSRQPYPSEMRHCVVSSGKQKESSLFDCARAGSTSLTQSSAPSRTAARKRADFFPYFACFMRHPARPLRFVCIPFPLSAVVHCMQAAVQKDPAGLFPAGSYSAVICGT